MLFIFDMGGVVSGNVQTIPAMAESLGLTSEEFFMLSGVPDGTPRNSLYDFGLLADIQSGRIGSAGFWEGFRTNADSLLPAGHKARKRIPEVLKSENPWASRFKPEPIRGTIELIRQLRAAGHRVVCGTNTLDAHYDAHEKAGDYSIFDKVYASHFLGVIKPDREFWKRILAEENEKSENAWFIDDNPPNVEAAAKLGFRTHQFTSPELLAEALELPGVN